MMHPDEIAAPEDDVRALLAPTPWGALPLRALTSSGTDNWIYRLGETHLLRIPRRPSAIAALEKELNWLPHLQPLPLKVPSLRDRLRAPFGNGCEVGVFDWMPGEIARPEALDDPHVAARQLADFLRALQALPTAGAPVAGPANSDRGIAPREMNTRTLPAIDLLDDEIDARAAHDIWRAASALPPGPPVWLHGDLKADNMIVRDGALTGVIDWGLSAVGDGAADLAAAWSWVPPEAHKTFRDALAASEADWLRARGWALYGAVIALSYYRGGKNEALCQQSRLTLDRLNLLRAGG